MLLTLNDKDPRPLYEQIVGQVKLAVAEGRLAAGESLPAVRELAELLGVNLHTVHKAYQQLRAEGVLDLRLGRRATVAVRARPAGKRQVQEKVVRRLEEVVTEAAVLGVTAEEFRAIVDRVVAGKFGRA